jgi:VanZ family protein
MSLSKLRNTNRWLPVLLWIVVIFCFSTDSFSSAETSRVIVPTLKFVFPFLTPTQLETGHIVCRKAGHILEYFVLGVLVWRAWSPVETGSMRPALFMTALILTVALSDEFHQLFVPSRVSAWTDVGYDVIGGMLALLLMTRFRNEPRTLHSHSVL